MRSLRDSRSKAASTPARALNNPQSDSSKSLREPLSKSRHSGRKSSRSSPENGRRTALYFFDMKDEAQIPVVAEPFFHGVNADITLIPVMNADDVGKGIAEAAKSL